MITKIKWRGLIFCLFLSFFLNSCTRPEENGIAFPQKRSSAMDSESSGPRVHTILIAEMKFQPEEIKVNKGDTVIWKNNDLVAHCITEELKAWTSSKMEGGASWKMAVNSGAGYFCAIHVVMKGKIIVK